GPGQLAGGEPQQPAPQLLLPAAAPGPGLLGAVAILPEPSVSGAKRSSRARGEDPGRAPDRAVAPPLARHAGRPPLPPCLSRIVVRARRRTLLVKARSPSGLLP